MGKRIDYQKGQELDPYYMKYLKEAEPDKDTKNPKKRIRKAEFECSFCKKHFIARICNVKNGHTKSCGCQSLLASIRTIQNYNQEGHPVWNRREYHCGDEVGDNNVVFIQDEPNRQHGEKSFRYAKFCCPICGSTFVSLLENVRSNKVKSCGEHLSLGEEKVASVLDTMKLNYIRQKTFPGLYSEGQHRRYPLKFDFYLPEYNCCIEYDGIQHFSYREDCISTWNTKENFLAGKNRDNIKNSYCRDNDIRLIRIPYTDKEKINPNYLFNLLDSLPLSDYNHKGGK